MYKEHPITIILYMFLILVNVNSQNCTNTTSTDNSPNLSTDNVEKTSSSTILAGIFGILVPLLLLSIIYCYYTNYISPRFQLKESKIINEQYLKDTCTPYFADFSDPSIGLHRWNGYYEGFTNYFAGRNDVSLELNIQNCSTLYSANGTGSNKHLRSEFEVDHSTYNPFNKRIVFVITYKGNNVDRSVKTISFRGQFVAENKIEGKWQSVTYPKNEGTFELVQTELLGTSDEVTQVIPFREMK
jgi:hypothetical protein